MAEEDKKTKTLQSDSNVISGIILEKERVKIRPAISKILRSADLPRSHSTKVQIIGGDSDMAEHATPPSIVIEKENDRISRILVKCPCGRHAELMCEYNEDENQEN
ncbi:MAG: hypothetical protein A2020_01605 [Lentisphaerae bacterium GWF2_45_14]|nr:MAG: hypothetical protein A2020_01605 [Lentisphaerae bacterium GWF2_45_14]